MPFARSTSVFEDRGCRGAAPLLLWEGSLDEESSDVVSARTSRGRRMLGKIRRGRFAAPPEAAPVEVPRPRELGEASWEHTARPTVSSPPSDDLPLRSRILSLFADPRV